jgi:hypothetical protein
MIRERISLLTQLVMITLVAFLIFGLHMVKGNAQEITPEVYKQLKYRHIGPQGNRVTAVVGVPGDPNVYYIGAASGGIFKTADGGTHWAPIFDDQQVSSIGSLAVAPSDSNIIWAGTGETFVRNAISMGNGVYKSTDGGESWEHMGLEKTGRIGRIVIDPRDPNIVFAAALGHCYGPQADRGVFRTTDGGQTWEKVLFVDENTGCSDIAMDPNNPRILFAGMWQLWLRTWGKQSGGPGSGLYMSRDGGATWKHLIGHGLPDPPLGKIAVAVAPSNSNRVYALIETGRGVPWQGKKTSSGVLWRSDDGGKHWTLVSYDLNLAGRCPYYTRCVVAPDDYNEIYFQANLLNMSIDGGKTIENIGQGLHVDHHDMWIDPTNGDRMIESNDGGVGISVNHGRSWRQINLPIAQLYHVAVDNQIPYYVYGNLQDGPSQRGPSNSLLGMGGIPRGMWHGVGGSEAGFAIPDPVDNNIVWSGGHPGGALDRYDVRTGHTRPVGVWPEFIWGWPAAELKYRFQRTFPIAISPHDHNKVYVGSQYVHQTTDGGHSWTIISPDLSTNDKSKQQTENSLTTLNSGFEYCVIFALAESPLEEGVIWAGTNDGQVQLTRDGGAQWTNVTGNIPNLPPWGIVRNIEPSRYDAGTCYISVDLHEVNNRDPHVYKTSDYGKSWKSISSDIPKGVFSYVYCVREDPVRKGLLYLGTENALYVSFSDGASWLPLQTNLPHAPVHWLTVQEHFNDLVVGTYGRGFWILDDIAPLQQLTSHVIESDVHLFAPRPAYRFRNKTAPMSQRGDQCVGQNPPYGADINYYLKSVPMSDVNIRILDEKGHIVRTLKGTKKPGINRVWWDLRSNPSKAPKLRTSPLYSPHVRVGTQGWRPLPARGGGRITILMPPGTYSVKLTVDDQEFSQKLTVKKDPNSSGTEEDIQAQMKILLEIRDNIDNVVDMINQIEWIRKQIYDLIAILEEEKSAESVITAGNELDEKLIAVEKNLFQMEVTGRGQDANYWPSRLIAKLSRLARFISSSDFSPTTQQIEVHEEVKKQLPQYQSQFNTLLKRDIPDFNSLLKEKNIPNIIVVKTL